MNDNTRCDQTKMFLKLNEKIKEVMNSEGAETKLIKEGEFERVAVGGKSPQPLMTGEWQLKVIKLDDAVKYIIVINKSIVQFGGACRYNSFIQKVRDGKGVDILCVEKNGEKSKGHIKAIYVKNKKFLLHKFRTAQGDIISFVAEFID